jgi:hypothetical protein
MSDLMVVTWVQGYLSGTNTQRFVQTGETMKLQPDPESVKAFVDKHCRDNPLDSIYQASMQLDHSF